MEYLCNDPDKAMELTLEALKYLVASHDACESFDARHLGPTLIYSQFRHWTAIRSAIIMGDPLPGRSYQALNRKRWRHHERREF